MKMYGFFFSRSRVFGLCHGNMVHCVSICVPQIYENEKTDTVNCICGAFFIGEILFLEEDEIITRPKIEEHYRACQCV